MVVVASGGAKRLFAPVAKRQRAVNHSPRQNQHRPNLYKLISEQLLLSLSVQPFVLIKGKQKAKHKTGHSNDRVNFAVKLHNPLARHCSC